MTHIRCVFYHISTKYDPPIVREKHIEINKSRMKCIRTIVREALKEVILEWVLPIGGLIASAVTLEWLLRYILICIYTLAN